MPLPAGFYMRFEVFTVQSLSDLCMHCVWKYLNAVIVRLLQVLSLQEFIMNQYAICDVFSLQMLKRSRYQALIRVQ